MLPTTVVVKPVETYRERLAFLDLPWTLYRNDPHWVPPIRENQWELLNYRKHPFYDTAKIRTFLAWQGTRPVGRIAAILNPAHNRHQSEKRTFFGFFESIDDQSVASALMDEVRRFAREEGFPIVRGPANPSLNYECGLLVEGFDSPPTFMMTYNPPYYSRLIEQCGFEKVQDMYAFGGHFSMLASLDKKMEFVIEEATRRFNIQLRGLDRRRFGEDVRTFLDIYNKSLGGTWGYAALSPGEVDHVAKGLRQLIVPELTTIAEVEGKPVAAAFGLLDYNPRIKQIDGRLFPFGFLRLLFNRRSLKRIRLVSANVLPEYQRWGLGLVILARLIPAATQWGMEEAEFSWVLESNHLSCGSLKRGGAKLQKVYRMYDALGAREYDRQASAK